MFFHGTPGSRLMAAPAKDDVSLGVRLIAPDRPGMGLSDYNPKRTILNWADDVRDLADALHLDRFVVAGVSGGGPHALACAHALPDRVIRAGVISGAAPLDMPGAAEEMHSANRLVVAIAVRAPFLLRPVFGWAALVAKRRPDAAFSPRQLPAADVEVVKDPVLKQALIGEALESYRRGVRAIADEVVLLTKPWGFALEDVRVPVLLWHATDDRNAPLAMAKEMERRIPDCAATYFEGEGHLYFLKRWPEIARSLVSGA